MATVEALVTRLNPKARQLRATHARVPMSEVLDTGRLDLTVAETAPGWVAELNGEHIPETIEYGIGSLVYRAVAPFHPQRLCDLLPELRLRRRTVEGVPLVGDPSGCAGAVVPGRAVRAL